MEYDKQWCVLKHRRWTWNKQLSIQKEQSNRINWLQPKVNVCQWYVLGCFCDLSRFASGMPGPGRFSIVAVTIEWEPFNFPIYETWCDGISFTFFLFLSCFLFLLCPIRFSFCARSIVLRNEPLYLNRVYAPAINTFSTLSISCSISSTRYRNVWYWHWHTNTHIHLLPLFGFNFQFNFYLRWYSILLWLHICVVYLRDTLIFGRDFFAFSLHFFSFYSLGIFLFPSKLDAFNIFKVVAEIVSTHTYTLTHILHPNSNPPYHRQVLDIIKKKKIEGK